MEERCQMYLQIHIDISIADTSFILAYLSETIVVGTEEKVGHLIVYMRQEDEHAWDDHILAKMNEWGGVEVSRKMIQPTNWNKVWESNFQPITVDDFVYVRADFHPEEAPIPTDFTLLVNPKMAFGTGHHETTRLMIKAMRNILFKTKHVLDLGTGSGILAILAKFLGARTVLAVDIDQYALDSASENFELNDVHSISLESGVTWRNAPEKFDVVLANINIPVLLEEAGFIYHVSKPGAQVLLSGILLEVQQKVEEAYRCAGFTIMEVLTEGEWCAILLKK